jgi:paired amphipathic helix protein Sin3a
MESVNGSADRQLNVTDALSYLDAVKVQFHDRPDVYNVFLDIMKEFKSQVWVYSLIQMIRSPFCLSLVAQAPVISAQAMFPFHRVIRHKSHAYKHVFDRIDTPGVIQRVASLFHGHPSLIQGFNTFLPVGYRIEVGSDAQSSEVITFTTPSGTVTMLQVPSTNSPSIPPPLQQEPDQPSLDQPLLPSPLSSTSVLGPSNDPKSFAGTIDVSSFDGQERQGSGPAMDYHERQGLGPAMDYVQRIKTRFSNDPDTYKQIVEILTSHKSSANNVRRCYHVLPCSNVPPTGRSFCES